MDAIIQYMIDFFGLGSQMPGTFPELFIWTVKFFIGTGMVMYILDGILYMTRTLSHGGR